MKYTPSQKEAVGCIDTNLQIIACAGSGKTQVIAARAVELLRRGGAAPRNIVAFTFTDKASAELKDRIRSLAATDLGDVRGLAEMYVGTIHGFCLELLQNYLFEFLKYNVLNEMQTRLLVSRNSKKSGLADVGIIAGPSTGQRLNRRPRDVSIFLEALNVIREDIEVKWAKLPSKLRDALDKYTDLLDDQAYLD